MRQEVKDWIAEVKSKAVGRTRFEGQAPFIDELIVEEIEELEKELDKMVDRYYIIAREDWEY